MKLTVISPTFNEADNVARLVTALKHALSGRDYEILIVDDDSPDRTWEVVERIARSDRRVRVLRRTGKRGLGFAVIDGFRAASGDALACIDADLQHDPAVLPAMAEALESGAGLVVGCRYMPNGGVVDWSLHRRLKSRIATRLAQWLLGVPLRDPMSGYFMMWRKDFLRILPRLDGAGFKIFLEIVAAMPSARVAEVPYTFRARTAGASKLSNKVVWLYLRQLWRLRSAPAVAVSPPAPPAEPEPIEAPAPLRRAG